MLTQIVGYVHATASADILIDIIQYWSVVISGDGWFYDFGDSNRAFKRDCTVYTGY